MAVCIAGMHRSGTSLVARLLNLCGLYLGPADEFLPPNASNPEGYWENTQFVWLNDAILNQFDTAWDLQTPLPEGWPLQPEMIPLRNKAADLVQRFGAHAPWGWKDPRSSLTLAFWKLLLPDLKVVICLRNPLDVAQSLTNRGNSSTRFGLNLWELYNQRLLSVTRPEDRVVTHYDAYFENPHEELRRVLGALDLSASDETIEQACSAASPAQRHSRTTVQHLLERDAPLQVVKLYLALCAEAGPVCQAILNGEPAPDALASELALLKHRQALQALKTEAQLQELAAKVAEKEQAVRALTTQVAEKERAARAMTEENENLRRQVDRYGRSPLIRAARMIKRGLGWLK